MSNLHDSSGSEEEMDRITKKVSENIFVFLLIDI